MTRILAIDPGNTESGYALIESDDCEPIKVGKIANDKLRRAILTGSDDFSADHVAIEMIASYGMAVGKEVFETCVWIGRFSEAVRGNWYPHSEPKLIVRKDVKMHHCHSNAAKDSNITQALVDRFACGQKNFGKGTKAAPGFFYGFAKDMWAAYALAVLVADRLEARAD